MTTYKFIAYRTECMTSTVEADTEEQAMKLWQRGLTDLTDDYHQPTEWEVDEIEVLEHHTPPLRYNNKKVR